MALTELVDMAVSDDQRQVDAESSGVDIYQDYGIFSLARIIFIGAIYLCRIVVGMPGMGMLPVVCNPPL